MAGINTPDKKLTCRQQVFVEEYLTCWNGTKAAEHAGFKSPAQSASGLLKRPNIAAAITKRMAEKAMAADEVLARLADEARVNIDDFLIHEIVEVTMKNGFKAKKEKVEINWPEIRRRGHLIKKLSWDTRGNPIIELYDSQNAKLLIGRYLKLFVDRTEMTGKDGEALEIIVRYEKNNPDAA